MQNISLFKLSRYFFVWFLLITVLPLLSLLVWNNYELEQGMRNRHKQLLELFVSDSPRLFANYLDSQVEDMQRIMPILPDTGTSLNEYKVILDADQAFWLNSPEALAFIQRHPEIKKLKKQSSKGIQADYFIKNKQMACFFLLPLRNSHQGLLLIQPVPLELIVPKGPIQVELYAGNQLTADARIFKSRPPFLKEFEFKK